MKIFSCILFMFALSFGNCYAQKVELDFKLFRLKGLKFDASKEEIAAELGKPKKVVKANNECGFHSVEQGTYYELCYEQVTFIGNAKEKYVIDEIEFNPESQLALEYGKVRFTHKMSMAAFAKMFKKSVKEDFDDRENGVKDALVFFKESDAGLVFSFKAGYLIKIHYWSPC
ncbi:hypothetical protein [Rufibacter sp. LB8]|uniref:hypothetical protein n=1 Tax=Rufibacter sp. LB8 TaxID=2777781 RepID=UPI00178C4956|nr:hypothetical protein [Rufibacter sp. LB8]